MLAGRRREPAVTLLLGAERSGGHYSGVAALESISCPDLDSSFSLISGSRDGTVRSWADPLDTPYDKPVTVLEAHTDWVMLKSTRKNRLCRWKKNSIFVKELSFG